MENSNVLYFEYYICYFENKIIVICREGLNDKTM